MIMGTKRTADYVVTGGGAMGMAFTDTLMTESDATVIIVDKHHRPGGHWNDAYPFVRLHQPSVFYGVNSKKMGNDAIDQVGWNVGLFELASGAEVCAYFDQVMQRQFLPSGRVEYFPMCESLGEGRVRSLVSGEEFEVEAKRATVDATYMNVTVPSVRPPAYDVAAGVKIAPLNELPKLARPATGYVIVGAGKTGIDACLWLLANRVDPDAITWIMPRDSWLLDRAKIQPGRDANDAGLSGQFNAIARSETIQEVFETLDSEGELLRLSKDVWPTMYRCATVTLPELEQLRRIKNVVRMGRVQRIEPTRLILDQGTLELDVERQYIDCSADGLERRASLPVFDGSQITLQTVRPCQQVFSAAFIAHVAASDRDESAKNALCAVAPHPDTDLDFLRATHAMAMSQVAWMQDPEIIEWLTNARLNIAAGSRPDQMSSSAETLLLAVQKLQQFVAELDA
jgi:hypothetical protein